MLWDLIRDFFVQHVFGGMNSEGYLFDTSIGNGLYESDFLYVVLSSGNDSVKIGLGDWLSTTATAISITIIVVLCCLFVYKIIKLIGGLIR